ncbi:uncharacterized protein M6B38_368950 [Iris pallida]|uniref:HTH myb-type domain-containing protein n=1 Tax=Iris pallida TaxID=29817 RepID=A0AAX6GGC3_IRIPA|nr:uncharacterized protein M6B38_368950 [Iris pallida]
MGSPSELSLDYKPNSTAAYPPVIPKPPSSGDQPAEQTQKIEDFLARLEEERHKIEAFKRELPLCMQLLNNALETYRQQLGGTYQKIIQGARPVLEEFIPLANMSINGPVKAPTAPSEKASWMVSAQLWSPAASEQQAVLSAAAAVVKEDDGCSLDTISPKLALDCKQRNGGSGGAFLPFSKERMIGKTGAAALPELALAPSEKMEVEESKQCVGEDGKIEGRGGSNRTSEGQADAQSSTQRKARRCWSPDLHRRFVNALQMLGGSQVATPKQIRELMKVDGLTNDEVKSHLQKYRLHTRRPIPQQQPTAVAAAPQLVVLGGIWVPPEYAAAAAAGTAIYGAHPQAHYAVPHEFYSAQPPAAHHVVPHPHLHRSIPAYKAAIRSPESEIRSGGGGGGDHRSETSIQEEEEDDDDGHGIEEDEEEEEEEVDQDEIIDVVKVKGEEKAPVPVGSNGSCSSTGVALKF